MLDENLAQQKDWYRFFPDGTIEFTVITRVLAIILLGALALVPSAHRPLFLTAFAAVIWIDYIIVLWWALQIGGDLDDLATPARRRTSPMNDFVRLAIPSIAVMMLVAPWPELVIGTEAARARIARVAIPALGVLFIAAAFFSWKVLDQKGLGLIGRVLMLIPGLHWFAVHRLVAHLQNKVDRGFSEKIGNKSEPSGSGTLTAADATLALCLCFFLLRVGLSHSAGTLTTLLHAAGMFFAALFAVIDLAAMESLQRRFVTLVRKL